MTTVPSPIRTRRLVLAIHLALGALSAPALVHAEDEGSRLPQVTVLGQADQGYRAAASSTATKTDILLRDTPQSVTVVTRELIRDQAMQSMADVIRYMPGVVAAQGEGNRDTAVFRGNSSTGDFFIDGMRDDVQYFRDFYNIDAVEALKGPNAMIFGRGGSGGVINRVSKAPVWSTTRELAVTLGAWKNRRAALDLGQAINDVAAVRLNAMVEDSGSYRKGVEVARSGINPTIAFLPGAATRVVLGVEHFEDSRVADRGVPSFDGKPLDTDPSTFFGNPDLSRARVRLDAFSALLEHEFGNGALLRNRLRYAHYDKFYQNVYPSGVTAAGASVRISGYNNGTRRGNLFNQTDLTFRLDTGALRHTLATGIELGRQITDNKRNTGYFAPFRNSDTSAQVALANPILDAPVVFRPSATDADNHGVATVTSAYLQDQIEFSPQWQAVAGVRYDRFGVEFRNHRNNSTIEVTDTPFSPRVGIVYKPAPAASFYASYSLAFVPRAGDQLASLTPTNAAFDPEQFRNVEAGVKWDLLPRLSASAALYRLDRKNVVIADPNDATRSILVDGQRTEGVELELSGSPTRNWSVTGGYAYQNARLTATQSANGPFAGAALAQVPRHTLSLWNRLNLSDAWALGAGLIYRDRIYPSTDNKVTLPAFTRVDAALFYKLNKNLALQLNVENLANRKYYSSANNNNNITPGSPRAVRLGLHARL